jgi:glucose-6-phosphate isomerase
MVLDAFDAARRGVFAEFESRRAVERAWAGDHTLWQPDAEECANRLGWLTEPTRVAGYAPGLLRERVRIAGLGIDRVLWCGMGGSSLFPALITRSGTPRDGGLAVSVLDTVHPAAIARASANHPAGRTLYVFASKSGGTVETRTQLDHFTVGVDARHVGVVTDAGSSLDALARERGWWVWNANPEIGGRFSALSHFGMVPAALAGIDPRTLADPALAMAARCSAATGSAGGDNPAAQLAAFVAAGVRTARDKLTIVTPPALSGLGAWIEQLVAESTGKHGTGVLPVVDEPLGGADEYGDDRVFVTYGDVAGLAALRDAGHPILDLGPAVAGALGGELFRWQFATALLGAALGVNPFDQPDVEAAKLAAAAALARDTATIAPVPAAPLLATMRAGDHIVFQAFVDPDGPVPGLLEALRARVRARCRCAVTVAIGPRYLHSTGQFHKGGPNTGVHLQLVDLVDAGPDDVAIPGRRFTFGRLLRAQADGDHAALVAAGRRVARVELDDLLALGDPLA